MWVKLENGRLLYMPKGGELNGVTVSNFSALPEETLRGLGWKTFVDAPMPEWTDTTGYTMSYVEDDMNVTKVWTPFEIIPSEVPDETFTYQERTDFVEGLMESLGYTS